MIHVRVKPNRLVGAVFMMAGAGIVAYVAAVVYVGAWLESRDRMEFAASLTQGVPLLAMRDPRHRLDPPRQDAEAAKGTRGNVVPISLPRSTATPLGLGIVEIDRLGLSVLIRSGIDSTDLNRGAGWIPGTAMPGREGNVAVAGHRDTFFRELRHVRTGDQIRLQSLLGTRIYTVTETMVVEPADTRVLRPTSNSVLTLVTCFPFDFVGTAPKRFVVRAAAARPNEN